MTTTTGALEKPDPRPEPNQPVVPAPAKVRRLGRNPTAGHLVQRAISVAARHVVEHDPVVRRGDDPEGVHQMRVALRRLRSDLRTFGDLLEPAWSSSVKELSRPIAAALGAGRDLDVLRDRLQSQASRLPITERAGTEPVFEQLLAQQESASSAIMGALTSSGYGELLGRLGDLGPALRNTTIPDDDELRPGAADTATDIEAENLADQPAERVARAAVRRAYRRLRRHVRALPSPAPDQALHDLRIQVKRVRYAAEAATPVIGRPAARLAGDLSRLQDVLGDHQDAVTAVRWLRGLSDGADDASTVWSAGVLAGLELSAAAEARERFGPAWKRVEAHRQRRWLKGRKR